MCDDTQLVRSVGFKILASCSWHRLWARARSNDLSTIVFINSNLFEGYRPTHQIEAPAAGVDAVLPIFVFCRNMFPSGSFVVYYDDVFILFRHLFLSQLVRCSFVVPSVPASMSSRPDESTSLLFCRNIFDWSQRIIYGSSWWFIHCIPSFLSEQLGSLFLCQRRHFNPSQKASDPQKSRFSQA